jgi:hypothetical protein
MSKQQSQQEGTAQQTQIAGVNGNMTVSFTVNCPSQQVADTGEWYRRAIVNKSDMLGTLEILTPDGVILTYNNAIMTQDPTARTVDSTATSPTFVLNFDCDFMEAL